MGLSKNMVLIIYDSEVFHEKSFISFKKHSYKIS